MSPPLNDLETDAIALRRRSYEIGRTCTVLGSTPARDRRVHAVPVVDLPRASNTLGDAVYRSFEWLVAALALIVAAPIMLIEALLIRWDSPGPVLFLHTRPGRSVPMRGRDLVGRTDLIPPPGGYQPDALYYVPSYFRLAKFRTMYHDARDRYPELYAYDFAPEEFRQNFATIKNDPRVTRVGAVLRKLSLDELPNLWSVLRGDMRLVGPRPEAPEVLCYYTPEEMYKFAFKPGVTGLSQINGRGLLTWGEILMWDLRYVRSRSIWRDLKILLITSAHVITRRGAF